MSVQIIRGDENLSCESTRYLPGECSETPPRFRVVYRNAAGKTVLDDHPACFRHGLAEVDRHHASRGMARCELVGPR